MDSKKMRGRLLGASFGLAALTAVVAANEAGIPKAIGDAAQEEFDEVTRGISEAYNDFVYQYTPTGRP